MPLRIVQGQRSNHPITGLSYPTVVGTFTFGKATLRMEHIAEVEAAIDLVFDWLKKEKIPDEEIEHLAPYFGSIWPSATALGEYMAREGEQGRLKGKTVLELGCGLAVPGLVAAQCGARVTLSDGHPDVVRFLEKNIQHNSDPSIDYIVADWRGLADTVHQFDYVIASDILYEPQHAELFSRLINNYCHKETCVIVADPGRAYIQSFVQKMNGHRWRENLAPWVVRHKGKDQDIYLLTFERSH